MLVSEESRAEARAITSGTAITENLRVLPAACLNAEFVKTCLIVESDKILLYRIIYQRIIYYNRKRKYIKQHNSQERESGKQSVCVPAIRFCILFYFLFICLNLSVHAVILGMFNIIMLIPLIINLKAKYIIAQFALHINKRL